MTAGGVALLVLAVLVVAGVAVYGTLRWQRRADQAPRAKVVTADKIERAEIKASQKKKKLGQLGQDLDERFGDPDQ